jgi:hypothetical protein
MSGCRPIGQAIFSTAASGSPKVMSGGRVGFARLGRADSSVLVEGATSR